MKPHRQQRTVEFDRDVFVVLGRHVKAVRLSRIELIGRAVLDGSSHDEIDALCERLALVRSEASA